MYQGATNLRFAFLVILTLLACVALGSQVAASSYQVPFLIIASIFLLLLSFLSTRLSLGVMIFAMLLSPEFVIGNLPKRDIVVRMEDLMIAVLGVYWLTRIAIDKNLQVFSRSPLNKYIVLYMAVALFATARGIIVATIPALQASFYVVKYFQYFFIYFIVLNLIRDKRHIHSFLKAFILTFLIVNVYAIYAKFTNPEMIRTSAPFEGDAGEPNTLGGYQVLLWGIIIGLFLHIKSFRIRLLLAVIGISALYPFLHTLSRASYMAFIPMYLTFVLFHRRRRLFLTGLMTFAIIIAIFFIPKEVTDRIAYTFVPHEQVAVKPVEIYGISLGPSASARVRSWMMAYGSWVKRPYIGFGVTGYAFLDSQYIRVLLELGVFGFVAFMLLIITITWQVYRIYRRAQDPILKGLALGFLAGHIGVLTHALTANTFIIIRIMEPYWFLAAMVMAIPKT